MHLFFICYLLIAHAKEKASVALGVDSLVGFASEESPYLLHSQAFRSSVAWSL